MKSFDVRERLTLLLGGVVILSAVSGCSLPFPVYSASGRNVEAIRNVPRAVKVGQFVGDQKSISCRLQPLEPQGGETFAAYIRNAFNEEIIMAGAKTNEAGIGLNGTLKDIDVDCGILSASWTIEMELSVGDRPPFTVKTIHNFDGNYFGAVVFSRAHAAFVPAIQHFINDVVKHPSFQAAGGKP